MVKLFVPQHQILAPISPLTPLSGNYHDRISSFALQSKHQQQNSAPSDNLQIEKTARSGCTSLSHCSLTFGSTLQPITPGLFQTARQLQASTQLIGQHVQQLKPFLLGQSSIMYTLHFACSQQACIYIVNGQSPVTASVVLIKMTQGSSSLLIICHSKDNQTVRSKTCQRHTRCKGYPASHDQKSLNSSNHQHKATRISSKL